MTARSIVWAGSGQERCLSSSKPHLILTIALDSVTLDLSRRVQIHLFELTMQASYTVMTRMAPYTV
jgi:hypothetical protein